MTAPTADGTARRGSRSKLTPEREQELYEAVLDLLRDVGYEALTMDAVAARTRSSKATLYRQWGGKPQLVAAALGGCGSPPPPLADLDTGSLAEDLRMLARWAARDAVQDTALLRALGHAMQGDAELARIIRESLVEPELVEFRALLRRSVERGEMDDVPPAAEYLPHMFFGVLLARPIIDAEEADEDFLVRFVDTVVLPMLGL
ncbi:TetR/AcrR family transcriptional regulator [Streptomyces sp. 549]|uniref:TetR/AcrR family transcriptional regulator n=1 Tax=Streptomyces sp. 549 TaxID=3049076 RepID=UPI0024C42BBC|nr:TetR/AcrR family transcriptional regulator [Streptomyces sp. 549]MDK1472041.1 TetR/AcrR family transcriptional regulator [Streptomyces sp. 549]